jgi:hypothetical protein
MSKTISGALALGAASATLVWAAAAAAQSVPASDSSGPTLAEAIAAGKPIIEVRARFEDVDQKGFSHDATAYTVRTHLGWQTGAWHGVTGLLELSNVQGIGAEHYNTTVNGKAAYPTIADPDQSRLNRAQLTWTATNWLTATVGRQRILLDDQRFVGNVGWRQNEQVFDAAKIDLNFGALKGGYTYIQQVNRVFGDTQNWKGDVHLITASYTVAEPLKLQAFDYLLDFKTNTAAAKAASTATAGGKISGKAWVSLYQLTYGATFAEERNYGPNPHHFKLDYYEGDLAATYDIFTLKGMYESMQGDKVQGFSTPLATLHAFQGWADVFLTTPAKGIKDGAVSLSVKPRFKLPYLFNTEFFVRYDDFKAQTDNTSLGSEWDLQATGQITPKISALLKFADYQGVKGFASRDKVWVGLEYKY